VSDFFLRDIDFVMLSFDEPNADENFADLKTFVPWAKRSHYVKGFDAAHRAAADLSSTDILVTIDADNIVDPAVLDFKIRNPHKRDRFALSLNGMNYANGLVYGNGSVKVWTKSFIYGMNSHEHCEEAESEKQAVDFCFDQGYNSTYDTCYSLTVTNGSEYQSWRSGFREGVKKGIQHKEHLEKYDSDHHVNTKQSLIWAMVGSDVKYGAIGADAAAAGMALYFGDDIEVTKINDYWWLEWYYNHEWPKIKSKMDLLRKSLGAHFKIPNVPLLDPQASIAFKRYNLELPHIGNSKARHVEWEIQ
jgi:hypothetical protein